MWQKIWRAKFNLLWLVAVGLRLYSLFQPAHPYDIGTYQSWGQLLLAKGPAEFYATTWSDYLPLPTYLFGLVSYLSTLTGLAFPLAFKGFFSLLELGLIAWLYRLFSASRSRYLFSTFSLLLLSPALIGDTAYWGQTDSLPALLSLVSLTYFLRFLKSHSPYTLLLTTTLFTLAVAFKPITLLILPVFATLFFTARSRPSLLPLILAALGSLLLFFLLGLPVATSLPGAVSFLFAKSLEQATTYPYLSINAYNLWTIRDTFTTWLPDSQVILGLSAHTFGQLVYAILTLRVFWLWAKNGWSAQAAYRVAATLLIVFYTFTTRMHERHLLFGLPFLTLAISKDRWLILPLVLLTFTFTANLYAAYYWMFHDHAWPFSLAFARGLSWMNVVLALGLSLVWDWPAALRRLMGYLRTNRALLAVLLLALTIRLIGLGHPDKHIFDEVYHAFTAQEMVKNNPAAWEWWNTPPEGFAYEWTHPPVAKYGMVFGLLLFGDTPFGWRFFSVVFGVISLYGFYCFSHLLFRKSSLALLCVFLLSWEGLHLVQSRIGMNDIYLLAFLVWSLVFALRGRWKVAAILYGMALASKWSALYGLLPLALIYLKEYRLNLSSILQVLRLLVASLLTYLMTYIPFFLGGHTWPQFAELHRQMWYYHTHLVATHAYQSTPWQWIFSLRPVWYWVEYAAAPAYLYVQGNPLVLWLGLAAFLFSLPRLRRFPYLLLTASYLAFLVPWIFSPRIMFFYHYLPSASFLTVILASWLDSLSSRPRRLFLFAIVLTFLLLTPVYYGLSMPQEYWDTLFTFFPSWK